jgi:signal peptidase I
MALLIVIPVRIFALQGYHIPSGSMEETLLVGDVLFADKITFGPRVPFTDLRIPGFRDPKPGDVIIFKSPEDNVDLIKRCIAVEGQVVEMRRKQLYIDGQRAEEPYAVHKDPHYIPARDDFGPYKVPPNSVFVLGDNRDNSNDSRRLRGHAIPMQNVVAKARIIYFSWDSRGSPWWQLWSGQPRLGRMGKIL